MLFSHVWSENVALFERLMEIHSNPPITTTMALTMMLYSWAIPSTEMTLTIVSKLRCQVKNIV